MAEAQFYAPEAPGNASAQAMRGIDFGTSLMERATRRRSEEQMQQMRAQEMQKAAIMLPVIAATASANTEKARIEYDQAINLQEVRKNALAMANKATNDLNFINQVEDAPARAQMSREWLSRYSQLANIEEIAPQVKQQRDIATSNIMDFFKISTLQGAEEKFFNNLTAGLSPEERTEAGRVKLGLAGRASNAGMKSQTVTLPDGSETALVFDPRSGKFSIPQIFAPGGSDQLVSSPSAGNPIVGQSAQEEARAKEQGRAQAEKIAALPRRRAAVEKIDTTTDRLMEDIDTAISQVSTLTAGPGGTLLAVFPGTTARDLQATLDTIKANVGFEALQAMRDASKTGGALGSITERELDLLQATLANFQVGQSPSQLIDNLKKARRRIAENAGAARRALEGDYEDVPEFEKANRRFNESQGEAPKEVGKYKVKVIP